MARPNYDQQMQQVYHQQNAVGDIHNYNQDDPLQDMAIYQESSWISKALTAIGMLLIVAGFAIFIGSLFLSSSTGFNQIPDLPTDQLVEWSRQQMNLDAAATAQSSLIAVSAFGLFFLGMVITAMGSWRASKEAYRRRVNAQRR